MKVRIILVLLICTILIASVSFLEESTTAKISTPISETKYYSNNKGLTVTKVVVKAGEITNLGNLTQP